MSSPRGSEPSSQSSVRTPSRSVRLSSRGTPSSSQGTPSSRRRLQLGTSERDVIPPTENDIPSRNSQVASSPFRGVGLSEIDLSSPINYGTPSSVGSMRSQRSGIRGTPVRLRFDIGSERRMRTVTLDPNAPADASVRSQGSEADTGPELVIWGTNVVVNKCKCKFKRFIEEFIDETPAEDEVTEHIDLTAPLYIQKLEEVIVVEQPFLNLNCAHLESFDPELYQQLLHYPQEVIPTLDMAVNEMFFEKYPAAVLEHQIQVRPFNSRKTISMRSLNPDDIDQLITINGMVIRRSNIIPEVRDAFFRCVNCRYETSVTVEKGSIAEPTLCTSCSTNHCFAVIHNRSQFTDKQIIKLQESPDDIPSGQTPHTVSLLCYNDMVDSVTSGTRVTVTGIFRAVPIQLNPRMSNILTVYRTYIDVVHFRKLDVNRLHVMEDGKQHKFGPERMELLQNLATKDDIYERLANALSPSIFGNMDVKKGILLQLFGGTRKVNQEKGKLRRSEINILLCGDPGTSKSQFLSYVYDLVPRSQYTSGRGSSAVGLTAYVTKDPETRQLVLQTGALVLADNGICCIDEFDKMDDSTRSVLHEVMEQQSLSIAKAGIICQLNARTSILAAANPCESEWNTKKTIVENILLPHSLLSRFDLIFLMLDPREDAYDKRLGHHLVSCYFQGRVQNDEEHVEKDILKDYIAYAKENIHPKITEEASQELVKSYVQMRKIGSRHGQITAYPRQLESLIRMAEAHAKIRFSEKVEVKDVKEAYRLYREALKQSATDPLTGVIDVNILTTGQSDSHRHEIKALVAVLKSLFSKVDKGTVINYQQLFMELKDAYQKKNDVKKGSDHTALSSHALTTGHKFNFESTAIVGTEENCKKRKILEPIEYSLFDKCLKELQDEHRIILTPKVSIRLI